MKRAVIMGLSAAAMVASGTIAADQDVDRTGWPRSFSVTSASQGGTYFSYGSGWANLVAESLGIPGVVEVTGGPKQNMALVHTGHAHFGMTTLALAQSSAEGNSPIAPGIQMTNACAMFPMYDAPFSLTALASSGINSVSDIPDGARIGFGPAGGTTDSYFPDILEKLGVTFEKRNGAWGDLAGQLQDGLIDAILFGSATPVPAVGQLEAQTNINIIGFTDEERALMIDSIAVSEFDIPAGTYRTLQADSPTVSMWNFAIADCDLPASFVKAAVDAVMSDNERMVGIHRAAAATLPEHWDKNDVLKWHPGAAEWFRENAGADIPDDMIHGN